MIHPVPLLTVLTMALLAAGCVTDAVAPADAAGTLETAGVVAPTTQEVSGEVQVAASTPARSFNYGGTFATALALNETLEGVIVEVTWSASTPASESLSVWVREAGAGSIPPEDPSDLATAPEPLATASGESPLRLVLEKGAFDPGDYQILVRADAAPVGVAFQQPYTLFLTTFEAGVPFDPTFSAVAAE